MNRGFLLFREDYGKLLSGSWKVKDAQDILRQEYIDYRVAATPTRAPGNLTDTQHRYLNYGDHTYWIVNWTTNLHSRKTTLDTAYTAGDLDLSSAYRNPKKQVLNWEWPDNQRKTTNSFHVYGAAIDYAQSTPKANYDVWVASSGATERILYVGKKRYENPEPPKDGRPAYNHGHAGW